MENIEQEVSKLTMRFFTFYANKESFIQAILEYPEEIAEEEIGRLNNIMDNLIMKGWQTLLLRPGSLVFLFNANPNLAMFLESPTEEDKKFLKTFLEKIVENKTYALSITLIAPSKNKEAGAFHILNRTININPETINFNAIENFLSNL